MVFNGIFSNTEKFCALLLIMYGMCGLWFYIHESLFIRKLKKKSYIKSNSDHKRTLIFIKIFTFFYLKFEVSFLYLYIYLFLCWRIFLCSMINENIKPFYYDGVELCIHTICGCPDMYLPSCSVICYRATYSRSSET